MKKLFETLGVLPANTQASLPTRSFVSIGDDVFAVAHSPSELKKAMRMGGNVTGYALLSRA